MNDNDHYLVLDVPNNSKKLYNVINNECGNQENVEKINYFFKKCEEINSDKIINENDEKNNTNNVNENIENLNEEVIDKSLKTDILLSDCEEFAENNKQINEELDETV